MIMANWLVTGRIIPERKTFGHDRLPPLYIKEHDHGVDARVTIGVIDNQLVATIVGDMGNQSNVALKDIIAEAEQTVLNAVAFTSGAVFDVDVIGVIREGGNAPPESMHFHYMDNTHDVISRRNSCFSVPQIWRLCQGDDGIFLRMCLNDLKMALKYKGDGPLYCYRAVETIRHHIGIRHCVIDHRRDDRNLQWQILRTELGIAEEKLREIEKLSVPIRHGKTKNFTGAEWRNIITITWDVTEAYMKLLDQISKGQRRWPDDCSEIWQEAAQK
jgi:hypothetical protein